MKRRLNKPFYCEILFKNLQKEKKKSYNNKEGVCAV